MYGKNDALIYLETLKDELFAVSDQIWDKPEMRFEEYTAVSLQSELLKRHGFDVATGIGEIPTAFSAKFGSGAPVIALLGEYDALSGLSQQADVGERRPIADQDPGHGCGHNLLGVGSLGAALAIAEYLRVSGRKGTVAYFGCPAEEGGSGKAFMAREGVFRDVDIALSWHPGSWNRVWASSSLANVQVTYSFRGVSAHAAACPHLGRSALDALELMNVGVQFLREHIIPEARIHYAITETGGVSPNVVQNRAEAVYLIRAPRNDQVSEIAERVNQVARGAAMMTGTQIGIKVDTACSNLVANHVLEKLLYDNMNAVSRPDYTEEDSAYAVAFQKTMPGRQTAAELLGKYYGTKGREEGAAYDKKGIYSFIEPYCPTDAATPGSTDVGDVSWCCPTSQIVTATCAGGTSEHSWQMTAQGKSDIAHKGMLYAAKVLAAAAVDLFENVSLIEAAKEEFRNRVGVEGYRPLLPKDARPQLPEA